MRQSNFSTLSTKGKQKFFINLQEKNEFKT